MKLAFTHIPKTAGRSVEKILEERFEENYMRLQGNFINPLIPSRYNNPVIQYLRSFRVVLRKEAALSGHLNLSHLSLIDSSFKHCIFIRDPLRRLLSEYHFLKEKNPELVIENCPLEYALKNKHRLEKIANFYKKIGAVKFDFIGDMDKPHETFSRFLDFLNYDTEVPHVNSSFTRKDYGASTLSKIKQHLSSEYQAWDKLKSQCN